MVVGERDGDPDPALRTPAVLSASSRDTSSRRGTGPPLHVHRREDEGMYVLEGQIRFRVGDDEFVAGPDTWVWQPRGIPHTFKVESEGARALVIFMLA
jgi:mannose-6-phosphate isomerase-like protein (cupin superfamily)